MSYRILITGSRTWSGLATVKDALWAAVMGADIDPARVVVVHGGANGADLLADTAAKQLGLHTEVHPADWDRHGRAAGPIRNRAMVAAGADVCLAFPSKASVGTRHCMKIAREAGIPVIVIEAVAA